MHASDARGCDSNLSMAEPTYQLPPLPDAPRAIVMFVAMEREAAPIAAHANAGLAKIMLVSDACFQFHADLTGL